MKINMFFSVPPELAAKARSRWQALGGSDEVILPGDDAIQLSIIVSDRDSPDGEALAILARELGATPEGPVLLSESPVYDQDDLDKAEVLFLKMGSIERAIDTSSLVPENICTRCGLNIPNRAGPDGVRLNTKIASAYDLFRGHMLWFATSKVVDALKDLKGLEIQPTSSTTEDQSPFLELRGVSDMGYPVDGTVWSEVCPACDRKRGVSTDDYKPGYHMFTRRAWDDSDFLVSGVYPQGLYVSQRAWLILSDPSWRIPKPGISACPVNFIAE